MMNAIERLTRDHVILRSKLDVLESALRLAPDTWYVLREICYTLSRLVHQHHCREERVVAQCHAALTPTQRQQLQRQHSDDRNRLGVLHHLFLQDSGRGVAHIAPMLRSMAQDLRHHLEQEEQALFPVLERHVTMQEALMPAGAIPAHVDEVSTVNAVIREYPTTKRVFEQLFVSIPYEGCDCLDEVAWRHGLEAAELINRLERVVG